MSIESIDPAGRANEIDTLDRYFFPANMLAKQIDVEKENK